MRVLELGIIYNVRGGAFSSCSSEMRQIDSSARRILI
jgi:hypothetical protein